MTFWLIVITIILGIILYWFKEFDKRYQKNIENDFKALTMEYPVFSKEQIRKERDELEIIEKELKLKTEELNIFFGDIKDNLKSLSKKEKEEFLFFFDERNEISFKYDDQREDVEFMIEGNLAIINSKKTIKNIRNEYEDRVINSINRIFDSSKKRKEELKKYKKVLGWK